MRVRRFRDAGLARFSELIAAAAAGRAVDSPAALAADPLITEEIAGTAEVEPDALDGSRLQAAGYLLARLEAGGVEEPERDAALWAWLAALYFDHLCPRDRKGRYRPTALAAYVPAAGETRKTYRHRLLGPVLVFRAHRDDPYRATCLLGQPLARPGRLVERLASRPRLVACPAAVGAATLLFCDSKGAIRPGAAASVERLADVLMQLDRTYDIYGMEAGALLELLPGEFDPFRKKRRQA